MNSPTRPDSIVLVHGLWMTPRSWGELGCLLRSQGVPEKHARTTHGTQNPPTV